MESAIERDPPSFGEANDSEEARWKRCTRRQGSRPAMGATGTPRSGDGALEFDMATAGSDREGANPEQFFALGYAACFHSALKAVGRQTQKSVEGSTVTATVALRRDESGFSLAVDLTAAVPGLGDAEVRELLEAAHQLCPYSKATRGNIPVTLAGRLSGGAAFGAGRAAFRRRRRTAAATLVGVAAGDRHRNRARPGRQRLAAGEQSCVAPPPRGRAPRRPPRPARHRVGADPDVSRDPRAAAGRAVPRPLRHAVAVRRADARARRGRLPRGDDEPDVGQLAPRHAAASRQADRDQLRQRL